MMNNQRSISSFLLLVLVGSTQSFTMNPAAARSSSRSLSSSLQAEKIGIFFGTSTGNTESVAELIAEELSGDASEPIDIDSIQGNLAEEFGKYDALIVGTPTWNTGADTERSGTGWDEVYYGDEFKSLSLLSGKPVAVFGCGDSESYSENYCDAMGEIHDVFKEMGCNMLGYVNALEDYEHEESKAQRGDVFCGLALDQVNYDDLTEDRVSQWIEQLKGEGIMGGAASSSAGSSVEGVATEPSAPVAAAVVETAESTTEKSNEAELLIANLEQENAELRKLLSVAVSTESPASVLTTNDGFTPHYNSVTGSTMWTSPDGRKCYYTSSNKNSSP